MVKQLDYFLVDDDGFQIDFEKNIVAAAVVTVVVVVVAVVVVECDGLDDWPRVCCSEKRAYVTD